MVENKNSQDSLNVDNALSQSEAFIIKYKNAIMYTLLAIVIIIAGFFLYRKYVSVPKEEKASAALFPGENYFAQDDFESALNGDKAGYKGFKKIADEYSGTKAGNLAKGYAGICLAHEGKYQEAINYLQEFKAEDQMVGPAAIGAMGDCYAGLNQLDKATDKYMEAAKKADNNSLSPIFLLKAGELYEKLGKNDEAVKAYTEIKDKYFNSYAAMEIDKYIERATK